MSDENEDDDDFMREFVDESDGSERMTKADDLEGEVPKLNKRKIPTRSEL